MLITMENKVKFYQKMYEAHDSNYIESNDVQDLKESYYYKGRRDEAAEYDTLVKERELLIEVLDKILKEYDTVLRVSTFNKTTTFDKAKELLNNLQIKTT